MATLDEIFAAMPSEAAGGTHELLVIDADTREIYVPDAEMIFGVEHDGNAETKYFKCPRYVGKGIDLAACFLRVNFQNANGDRDGYLVKDTTSDSENVYFSWELWPKVTQYKGTVQFVLCASLPGSTKTNDWHTTLAQGNVLEGLEPDTEAAAAAGSDLIAQLLATVEAQEANVEAVGAEQVQTVQDAAKAAQEAAVAEIEAKKENVLAEIPDDYTAMGQQVDALTRSTAGAIVCQAEGTTIQVHDASDHPLAGLRIFGRSTQDGTPTPDNPVEIVSLPAPAVSVYGKNLCNMNAFGSMGSNGASNTYDAETHTITMNADATSISGRYGSPVKVLPVGKKCTVSFDIRGTAGRIVKCGWDKRKTTITLTDTYQRYSSTMEITVKTEPISFYTELTTLGGLRSGEYMQFANVQVEYGDTATEYKEYRLAETLTITTPGGLPGIPVTSGGNYTDADGQQWICDEVDLARGVYVQRVKEIIFDGVKNRVTEYTPWLTFRTNVTDAMVPADNGIKLGGYSSHYSIECVNNLVTGDNATSQVDGFGYHVATYILFKDANFVSTEECNAMFAEKKNAGAPVTLLYILAEPIETPLTEADLAAFAALHSVKPTTTILNDSGAHMAVEYVADTKLYIDSKLAELVAAANA